LNHHKIYSILCAFGIIVFLILFTIILVKLDSARILVKVKGRTQVNKIQREYDDHYESNDVLTLFQGIKRTRISR
jgi:hypothetical protein